jgi:hypothetical protein
MTPSNTTELEQQLLRIFQRHADAVLLSDEGAEPMLDDEDAVTEIQEIIARRDAEKREALLKAVGEDLPLPGTPTADMLPPRTGHPLVGKTRRKPASAKPSNPSMEVRNEQI